MIPNDHAVLVGCIDDRVVSMVEVSQQPVVPQRNPPVYPLPLAWKRQLYRYGPQQQEQPLQGWLCNLLVVPEYRGQGLSKVLVAACEGVARHYWQCQYMYLHCDADTRGDGRVPQQLYEQRQYLPAASAIASTAQQQDGLVVVDGVPLLYLRKDLTSLQ